MNVAIISAIIAAVTAFLTTLITQWETSRREDKKLKSEQEREKSKEAAALEKVISAHRDPLMRSAFDLQSRLYNILCKSFFVYYRRGRPAEKEYSINNSLYVVAEYFGWLEIIRNEIQFLNLGDIAASRTLQILLNEVSEKFSDDSTGDVTFRIFRGQQRAIGEVMILPVDPAAVDKPARRGCMGYAQFLRRLREDAKFKGWFNQLEDDFTALASTMPRPDSLRLIAVQDALVDLLEYLDRDHRRFPESELTKASLIRHRRQEAS
jgi:hypothetical protein